jgi:hypothetical protein
MAQSGESTESRARHYAESRNLQLVRALGAGYGGTVFETDASTAVKTLQFPSLYQRERDVYLRLYERDCFEVCGCRIPQLVDFDDALWVVEMEIVQPPFVLDFAGAYLDHRPNFPPEVIEDWQAEKIEQFGPDWDRVRSIMAQLARIGVYLADVKPGNITLR